VALSALITFVMASRSPFAASANSSSGKRARTTEFSRRKIGGDTATAAIGAPKRTTARRPAKHKERNVPRSLDRLSSMTSDGRLLGEEAEEQRKQQ
jgi:hypothetical protein